MTPERYRQIDELLEAALELQSERRAAFLAQNCAGDELLCRQVEKLLAAHEQVDSFLALPALEVAAKELAEAQTSPPAQSLIGRQLGRYRVLALLGAGGMGEVFLAQDTQLGRKVALKLLRAQFTQTAERVRRFEQEARAASVLNHPHIITIYEVGQADGLQFIVTEYIEGQTLRQRLGNAPLPLREALEVASQAASALGAAHAAGLVHRDIKPENIMLRPDGYIKILDFGIAKLIERLPSVEGADAALPDDPKGIETETGWILGTPSYMSPEQARGLKVDRRSDIFSLGILLYQMLSGHAPFAGATAADIVASILGKEPPPPSQFVPALPPRLEQIVLKALAKDRAERYQKAEDLLQALQQVKQRLEFEAELATAPEAVMQQNTLGLKLRWQQATHATKAAKYWLAGGALVLTLFAAGAAYHYQKAKRVSPAPPPTPNVTPARSAALNYYLETLTNGGVKAFATGLEPLAADQSFKFHFTPRERGFLYLIAPGERNVPTAFLTAQPLRATGVLTNEAAAQVSYSFPAGEGNWLGIKHDTHTSVFTVIFSTEPLTSPHFLAALAGHKLTLAEQQELETLRQRLGVRQAELENKSSGVAVFLPAESANITEPLIFDIAIRRK